MKVVELLKISMVMLKMMSENGILRDDWQYVRAYEEFLNMRKNRVKHRVAIRMLAEDYHVSERTLERAFKRLSGEC